MRFFKWLTKNDNRIVVSRLRNGSIILVPVNDFIGRCIYLFGELDPRITWILNNVLRPGDIFLDIGANLGSESLYAAKKIGDTGSIHAFEPQEELANLLAKSANKNGYSNITIHKVALSDESGVQDLYFPHLDNLGTATLNPDYQGHLYGISKICSGVHVYNTSEYLSRLNLGPIRLVKLDVEGMEYYVLKGGMPFFAVNLPDAILFEYQHEQKTDPICVSDPIITLLNSFNYRFFAIPRALFHLKLHSVNLDKACALSSHDILATQPKLAEELLQKNLIFKD